MKLLSKFFDVSGDDGKKLERNERNKLYKDCINIAWPSAVEGLLMSIISSVDTMMVGTLGVASISAVGLTAQPRLILLIIVQALCSGTTALCARRKGADDREAANACLMQSLLICTLLGILITLVGVFGAPWLMGLSGANEDTMDLSVAYFRIVASGFMFNCWNLCICAAMRAIGKTRITLVTNMTANLVNVCFNYLLINGNFGFPALGVRGAAIATVIGNGVATVIAICAVAKKNGYYHFALPKFDRVTISGIYTVGSSTILENVSLRIGMLINSRLVADCGTEVFAAYQIASQVSSMSFNLGDGISNAGTSLVGQSLGAKRRDLAKAHVTVARKISIVTSFALMLIMFLLRRQLALLFTDDANVIAAATAALIVIIVGMMPQNGRVVYSGCLRGAGDTRFVAICALVSVSILRPILTYLFSYPVARLFPGMYFEAMGPWIGFVIDAFVRQYLLRRRIKTGKWMDVKIS